MSIITTVADPTLDDFADWALAAVNAYLTARATAMNEGERTLPVDDPTRAGQLLSECIADLLHLADRIDADPDHLINVGWDQFKEEYETEFAACPDFPVIGTDEYDFEPWSA